MDHLFTVFLNSPRFLLAITHVVSIPSLILYVSEMIVIRRNTRQFSSSFYQLVYVQFITNVLVHISSYTWSRLENTGIFFELFAELPEFILRFLFAFWFYAFHAQNFATLLILLNRFTSVVLPVQHYTIWQRILPVAIVFVFGSPFLLNYQNFFQHSFYVVWSEMTKTYSITYRGSPASKMTSNSFLVALVSTVIGLSGIVLNVATVVVYVRRTRRRQTAAQVGAKRRKRERLEFRLIIFAIITFISQLFSASFMIVLYHTRQKKLENATRLLCNFFPLFGDLLTICLPACLMLWADRDLRKTVLALRIYSLAKSVTMPPTVDIGHTPTTLRISGASRI